MLDKFPEYVRILRGHPAALSALKAILEVMSDRASNTLLHADESNELFRAQGRLSAIKNLEGLFKDV